MKAHTPEKSAAGGGLMRMTLGGLWINQANNKAPDSLLPISLSQQSQLIILKTPPPTMLSVYELVACFLTTNLRIARVWIINCLVGKSVCKPPELLQRGVCSDSYNSFFFKKVSAPKLHEKPSKWGNVPTRIRNAHLLPVGTLDKQDTGSLVLWPFSFCMYKTCGCWTGGNVNQLNT